MSDRADLFFEIGEAAQLLNIDPNTLRRMADRNEIPCLRTGTKRQFAKAVIFARMRAAGVPESDIEPLPCAG